jgi:hypothetical protein
MKKVNNSLHESLSLLQGYYSYFLLLLYTDNLMKKGKIATPTDDVVLSTWSKSWIKLNTNRIRNLLQQIQKSPDAKNVYGYLGYVSGIKWLFGIFMDLFSTSSPRRTFLKHTLWQRYDAYIHIIRVCRNLLTHQHTPDLRISQRDIELQMEKLLEADKRIISLTFHYKDIFWKDREGSASYWFHISLNTTTLHTKRTLFDLIDEHTMFMLAESVFNLSEHYLKTHKHHAK